MSNQSMIILVIGATGSIGSLVVAEALRQGYSVRALVRSHEKARRLPAKAEAVIGDLTRPNTLDFAVKDIDAIIFTHGSDGAGKVGSVTVDYGGVWNVLAELGSRKVRIALMTAIGVTNRTGSYIRSTESHDWKRRAERLVRASGCPYMIVRPGWFDYNKADEHKLVFLQGDTRFAGNSSDGVIARRQIAEVLIGSLTSITRCRKPLSWLQPEGQHKRTWMNCSLHSTQILQASSMVCATRPTSHLKTSRNEYRTTCTR